jgi:hypothetical protein
MAMSPSLVYAQAPAASSADATRAAQKLDVSDVGPDVFFGAVIFPSRMLASPSMQMNPMIAMIFDGMKKDLGFHPSDIERLLIVAENPQGDSGPDVGLVLHFSKPADAKAIFPALREKTTEAKIDDKPFFRAADPKDFSLYLLDQNTALVAHEAMVRKMVANRTQPTEGRMSGVLSRFDDSNDVLAVLLIEPLRPMIKDKLAKDPPPPPYADVQKIPDLVHSLGLKGSLTGPGNVTLSLRCSDEAAATELERIINDLLAKAKSETTAQMSAKPAGGDPAQAAMAQQMLQASQKMIEMFRPTRNGSRLEIVKEGPETIAAIGMGVAMLLPAIQAGREAARRAVERSGASNDKK